MRHWPQLSRSNEVDRNSGINRDSAPHLHPSKSLTMTLLSTSGSFLLARTDPKSAVPSLHIPDGPFEVNRIQSTQIRSKRLKVTSLGRHFDTSRTEFGSTAIPVSLPTVSTPCETFANSLRCYRSRSNPPANPSIWIDSPTTTT